MLYYQIWQCAPLNNLWLLKEAHILSWWFALTFRKEQVGSPQPFIEPERIEKVSAKQANVLEQKAQEHQQRFQQAIEELESAKKAEQEAQREAAKLQKALDAASKQQYQKASLLCSHQILGS